MTRVLTLTIALLLVASSSAAEEHELWPGDYTLGATFDKTDQSKNFFHDVRVRLKSSRVTLVVLKDNGPKDVPESVREEEADDVPPKQSAGLGGFGGGDDPEWRRRAIGQTRWLPSGRKFHGRIDTEGNIRFGFTSVRDGKLISLHFIGRPSEKGATGTVYRLSDAKAAIAGTWELHSPNPYSLPIGPTLKGVPR